MSRVKQKIIKLTFALSPPITQHKTTLFQSKLHQLTLPQELCFRTNYTNMAFPLTALFQNKLHQHGLPPYSFLLEQITPTWHSPLQFSFRTNYTNMAFPLTAFF